MFVGNAAEKGRNTLLVSTTEAAQETESRVHQFYPSVDEKGSSVATTVCMAHCHQWCDQKVHDSLRPVISDRNAAVRQVRGRFSLKFERRPAAGFAGRAAALPLLLHARLEGSPVQLQPHLFRHQLRCRSIKIFQVCREATFTPTQ